MLSLTLSFSSFLHALYPQSHFKKCFEITFTILEKKRSAFLALLPMDFIVLGMLLSVLSGQHFACRASVVHLAFGVVYLKSTNFTSAFLSKQIPVMLFSSCILAEKSSL